MKRQHASSTLRGGFASQPVVRIEYLLAIAVDRLLLDVDDLPVGELSSRVILVPIIFTPSSSRCPCKCICGTKPDSRRRRKAEDKTVRPADKVSRESRWVKYPDLLRTVQPRLAIVVTDLTATTTSQRLLIELNGLSLDIQIALIDVRGAPVELVEIGNLLGLDT